MLFDILTGAMSALFLLLVLLYPFRKTLTPIKKMNKLKLHCISGILLLLVVFIHINVKLLSPYFSAGFLALVLMIFAVVTGILKRRFMKNKFLHYAHVASGVAFALSFLVHAIQQIINLLIM